MLASLTHRVGENIHKQPMQRSVNQCHQQHSEKCAMWRFVQPILLSGNVTNIKNAIIGCFTQDQIIQEKDTVYKRCGSEIIGEKQKRK